MLGFLRNRLFRLLSWAVFAGMAGSLCAEGQNEKLVVVELYTSQGCSSCSAADQFLAALRGQEDILALGFHVDYWDYLGWKDSFARPEFAARQRSYSISVGDGMIYTPQMIVNGSASMIGSDYGAVRDAIHAAASREDYADIHLYREGARLHVDVMPREGIIASERADILLVRFVPEIMVRIGAGENEGNEWAYVNVVTRISKIGHWNGRDSLEIWAPLWGSSPAAVILQRRGMREILAAARLEE